MGEMGCKLFYRLFLFFSNFVILANFPKTREISRIYTTKKNRKNSQCFIKNVTQFLCTKPLGLNAFLITTITSPRENSKQTNKQTASTIQKTNKQEESKTKNMGNMDSKVSYRFLLFNFVISKFWQILNKNQEKQSTVHTRKINFKFSQNFVKKVTNFFVTKILGLVFISKNKNKLFLSFFLLI